MFAILFCVSRGGNEIIFIILVRKQGYFNLTNTLQILALLEIQKTITEIKLNNINLSFGVYIIFIVYLCYNIISVFIYIFILLYIR